LQEIDDWQHRRRQEMARVTFDASQHDMLNVDLSESTDRGVTLRRTLSFLGVIKDQVKQHIIRARQVGELESLFKGEMGWREGLICRLLQRFCDAPRLAQQQADEGEMQFLRDIGAPTELPGEPERQEILRLLDEEIASVQEEFEYAEKVNGESAAIERQACLAPEGETWSVMLRQEAALDRSIDRKVRILLRLRKESANRPVALPSQDNGERMENVGEVFDSDFMSDVSESVETARGSKVNEQYGNVYENKGPTRSGPAQSRNVTENAYSYAQSSGMLLKTKEVGGMS
jgi:hypothetical protein